MSDVFLPLLVAIPIVLSVVPLIAGLRYERAGWPIAFVGSITVTAIAGYVAVTIASSGRLIHALGNYPQPYGIELVGDELSALVALLIAIVSLAVLLYARTAGPRGNAFYSGYLLLTGGLFGVALTGDMFNLFVFLEITSLVTYALVASDRTSGKAAYAAFKYVFLGTVGASMYLLGVGYLYVATGTLNMRDLQEAIASVGYGDPIVQAAFGFILVGFAIKVALFPLHTWQPDAYTYAPDSVSAYISALVSTASAYALIRITYGVFTQSFLEANDLIVTAILVVASVSIVVGSLLALMQTEVKRMFAYSSVAQFGMIVAAIGLANETALFGAILHLLGHGLIKAGLFMAAGVLATAYGARTVTDYAGLSRRSPYAVGGMTLAGIALIGLPPSIGFLGKWFMALGAVEAGAWGVAAVIFASTMLTLAYVFRLVEMLYFRSPSAARTDESAAVEVPDASTDGVAAPDGGSIDRVAVAQVAIVVSIGITVIALGFSWELFADYLDPVLGRFFA